MRFLIVNKFLYPNGGSETYIFGLGRQLQAMGHEVQYFGMEHPDRCVGNAVGAYTSNMDFHGGNLRSDHGQKGGNSALRKIKKLTLPIRIIYSREARYKIRQVLDDFKPDVVHLNNINFQITPSIIYEIRKWDRDRSKAEGALNNATAHTKIVFTAHDYQWICPNHMLYIPEHDGISGEICDRCKGGRFIECTKHNCIHNSKARSFIGSIEGYYYKWRKTYSMVDAIICPSKFLYDKFAENARLKDKLVVMHNFIETDRESSANDSNNYVLYFGRFAEEKGIRTLLEATKRLPDISFVFAGSGPLEDEVRSFADRHDNVSFVGFKTGNELKELIAQAVFTVYPSEWYENCPFSVMESISLGTPVLGSDIGGIPELVDSRGLLFRPGDIADLINKIRPMWSDNELLNKLTDNCSKNDFDSLEEYTERFVSLVK